MHATLSPKGQVVLPVAMRRRLRLDPGGTVEIEERSGGIFIRPAGSRPLPPARGTTQDLLAAIRAGTFAPGADWARIKAGVARRARAARVK
jgi:AbrB family looped-hinge helix DNA binding protein